MNNRKYFVIGATVLVIGVSIFGGALADRVFGFKPLDALVKRSGSSTTSLNQTVLTEESVVINAVESASPSVVTVAMQTPKRRVLQFDPFGFGSSQPQFEGGVQQDIGSGFVISKDGLIVTNKHVVDNTSAKYTVITKDGTEREVLEINRDPSNDLAILKVDATDLTPLELGDSTNLKVGQFVIAIGTALGEFRHTVTTGVISGLGRGIEAGDPWQGFAERIDDVIQTDAAINPGNSGGPLLNSAGQVIGVNVAVAQGAQNIGFALPINVVKAALTQFSATGKFPAKPFLGVQYQMIPQKTAVLNNVPQGALVVDVVEGSPAQKSGIEIDDIITKFDNADVRDSSDAGLAELIAKHKVGDTVQVEVWRNGDTRSFSATLGENQK